MDLSIIIPVFNTEKYVIRCLDSIFSQVFAGTLEVIVVDDASTDKSLEILRNYQKKEERLIIVEHKINRKEAIARASGMNVSTGDYIFEPSKEEIVLTLIPKSLKTQLYKSIRDSFAAEHGARMTAMHKATDNATELRNQLKLTYNKARQAAITNEILEIVGGAEALKG